MAALPAACLQVGRTELKALIDPDGSGDVTFDEFRAALQVGPTLWGGGGSGGGRGGDGTGQGLGRRGRMGREPRA